MQGRSIERPFFFLPKKKRLDLETLNELACEIEL